MSNWSGGSCWNSRMPRGSRSCNRLLAGAGVRPEGGPLAERAKVAARWAIATACEALRGSRRPHRETPERLEISYVTPTPGYFR